MSYQQEDAKVEWATLIDEALYTKNVQKAYIIRDQFAREDDMEQAEWWDAKIHEWEVDIDQRREELEQDKAELRSEEAERHYAPSEGFEN